MLAQAAARAVEQQLSSVYAAADEHATAAESLDPFDRSCADRPSERRAGRRRRPVRMRAAGGPRRDAQHCRVSVGRSPINWTGLRPRHQRMPGGRWGVRPNRSAMFASAGTIRAISTLLRQPTPVYARGIAMLSELLRDGTGPLYLGDDPALAAFLDDALNVMRTGEPSRAA